MLIIFKIGVSNRLKLVIKEICNQNHFIVGTKQNTKLNFFYEIYGIS